MNDAIIFRALSAMLALAANLACSGCAANPSLEAYDAQACVENALRRRPDPSLLADAAAQVKQSCGLGDSASCSTLGVMYELGQGVRASRGTAMALYRRACDAGNGRACGNLGELMLGDGSRDQAIALLRPACDKGQPRACLVLGRAELESSPQIGEATLARACERGEAMACVDLATRLARTGLPADASRAMALLGAACARGDEEGCASLDKHARRMRPRAPEPAIVATTPAVQP